MHKKSQLASILFDHKTVMASIASMRTPIISTIRGPGLCWSWPSQLLRRNGHDHGYDHGHPQLGRLRWFLAEWRCYKHFHIWSPNLHQLGYNPYKYTSSSSESVPMCCPVACLKNAWQGMVDVNVTPDKKTVFLHQEAQQLCFFVAMTTRNIL